MTFVDNIMQAVFKLYPRIEDRVRKLGVLQLLSCLLSTQPCPANIGAGAGSAGHEVQPGSVAPTHCHCLLTTHGAMGG